LAVVAAGAQGLPGHPPRCGLARLDRMRAREHIAVWRPCAAASAGDGAAHLPELETPQEGDAHQIWGGGHRIRT
jgi:hypothetical protein